MRRTRHLYMPAKARHWEALCLTLFCAILAGWMPGTAQAAEAADELAAYEQAMYSHVYAEEPLNARLERLESSVFGEAQTGSDSVRKAKILSVLSAARKVVPASAGANNSEPANDNDDISGASAQPAMQPDEAQSPVTQGPPDATDYPTVTALEREVFGRDFINDAVSNRLSRLEKKVFGQPFPQAALIDRVDRLLARYPNVGTPATVSGVPSNSAIRSLPSDFSQFAGSNRDVYTKINSLEQSIFNGKTYPNQLLTERLDRLEDRALGRKYIGESIDTRVNRLMKNFQVNTANARGTQSRPGFQNPPAYQPPPRRPEVVYNNGVISAAPPVPQNVQIGAGFSQNSTHQFSNELLDMLPNDVRAQLQNQTRSSGGTVMSSPGTVVMEQTTTSSYPGFQTYGGPPVQYYNYYNSPLGQVQTQDKTTTTVIGPDGSSAVYSYSNAGQPGAVGAGVPNPAYVGDPAFLQDLGNLELSVFGGINTMEPVYVRLGKLEMAIIGQMYPGYAEAQRLANLKKTWQLQSVSRLLGKGKAANVGRAAGSALFGVPLPPPVPGK